MQLLPKRRRHAAGNRIQTAMDGRWIAIESISGEGIRAFGLPFQKPTLYAVISVNGRQKNRTETDISGGKNPKWDLPMRFDLDSSDQFVEIRIMARGNPFLLRRGKHVGDVKVPVSALVVTTTDITCTGGGGGPACHVSYQVTTPTGKANGVIRFSYRISFPRPDPAPVVAGGYCMAPTQQIGYYPQPVYVMQMMPGGGYAASGPPYYMPTQPMPYGYRGP